MAEIIPPALNASSLVLSIVVPFFNEEEVVADVLREIIEAQPDAEIIAVDDGSTDSTWDQLSGIQGITPLRLSCNRGQSAAMLAGLRHASGKFCATMDGDGQNDPADIQQLLPKLDQADAVFGIRTQRRDSWDRRFASKVANSIRRLFINDGVADTGCSLKVFRRDMVEYLPPVNGMHRFMGAFFVAAGYRIEQVPVNHRPRLAGISKYGNVDRAIRGLFDLVGVRWYLKRRIETK